MSNTRKSKIETKKNDEIEVNVRFIMDETLKHRRGIPMHLFFFIMFTLLSLMLAYVAPYTLLLTVPFVLAPSYFAYTSVCIAKETKQAEEISFFRMFKVYFSNLFFGGYRLLLGLLKFLGAYVGCEMVLIFIFDATIFSKIPGYSALAEKLVSSTDYTAVFEEYYSFITSNETMIKFTMLATLISLVFGSFFFIQHIGKHSVKIRRNLFRKPPLPSAQVTYVYKRVRREHRGQMIKDYFKLAWFYQLLIVLAGAGGVCLSFFALKNVDAFQGAIISLALMFIVSIPLINYISKMQDLMFISLSRDFEEANVRLTLQLFERYKERIDISDEDLSKIKELLEQTKQELKNEENSKENNEEDKQ